MNENITVVNKIDLKNLSENEINQLPISVIIDNVEDMRDLQKISNEDKIVECISFIQDPQNNFLNYDKDKIEAILSSIFHCCKNAKNIYEKLSAEQIIGFQKMEMQQNLVFQNNVFEDIIEHISNGSHLEDKILAIVDVINNDSSLPIFLGKNFFAVFPQLKKLHKENKFGLDVNYIFNKISLEKFFEHNYSPGFFSLEESLNPELIENILTCCHNSEESGFALMDFNLFAKYVNKFGCKSAVQKILKLVNKINNQENVPNNVTIHFLITMKDNIARFNRLTPKNSDFKNEINEIYEKISTDKFFQYKDNINFQNMLPYLSEEKINQILEIFHSNRENNDVFAKNSLYWDKYANKFGKEALKEKFSEIINDINNGNISSDVAKKFRVSLRKNPDFAIKEILYLSLENKNSQEPKQEPKQEQQEK